MTVNPSADCAVFTEKTECTLTQAESYAWVSGGSAITALQTCAIPSDDGNVRGEVVSCSWTLTDSYLSTTNDTTVGVNCFDDEEKIECSLLGGQWACNVYAADRVYGNFETCVYTPQQYTCTDYKADREYAWQNCVTCEVTYK